MGNENITNGRITYDARVVANEFLRLAKKDSRVFTNMQLQKLVIIAHGFSLAILGEPLVLQRVMLGKWGPVIPDLWNALLHHGAGAVTHPIQIETTHKIELPKKYWIFREQRFASEYVGYELIYDQTCLSLIKAIYDAYCKHSGLQLSTVCHVKGSPWEIVYSQNPTLVDVRYIPDELFKTYYLNLLQEVKDREC